MKDWLFNKYLYERNYIQKAYGEVSWIKGLVEFFLIVAIAWKFLLPGTALPPYLLIILGGLVIITLRMVGWFWDKNKFFQREADWGNHRNPFVQEMLRELRKKRKL